MLKLASVSMSVSQLPVSIRALDGSSRRCFGRASHKRVCVENGELKCTAAFLSLFSNSWASASRKASRIWHYHFWLIYTLPRYEGRREVIFKKKKKKVPAQALCFFFFFFSSPCQQNEFVIKQDGVWYFMGALGAHNGLNPRDMPNAFFFN